MTNLEPLALRHRSRSLAAVLLLVACAATPALGQQAGGGPQDMPAAGGMPMDMHQSMMSGMDKMMSMPSTGDTDRDFATMMKMHHRMAIDMAKTELEKGKSPELKAMAQQIIQDSQRDIQKIDQWLGQHKR